jgi:ATP phosphoribosyltransferase
VRIVAAAPAGISDEALKSRRIIAATEYESLARRWLLEQGYNALVVRTHGATEVFPPDDADMIIDNTSSGRTLAENGLRIVDTLMESSTRFFASKAALEDGHNQKKILELKMLFEAVLNARSRVMLEMNVSKEKFPVLVQGLPAMRSPTVSPLYADDGFAIKIAVPKSEVPQLLPRLKDLGATDILEYELRKVLA